MEFGNVDFSFFEGFSFLFCAIVDRVFGEYRLKSEILGGRRQKKWLERGFQIC
jgi:hypothetical protein